MWRSLASNAMTILIVLGLAGAFAVHWGKSQFLAQGPLQEAICFQVPQGANIRGVADQLEERGAISSARIFRLGAEYNDRSHLLKAGSFLIPEGTPMVGVVAIVTEAGRSTCGTEINYRIGITIAEAIVRELDPTTNRYEEIVKFEAGAEEIPQEYLDARDEADVRFRVTLAEGVTSWHVVDGLRKADFLSGEIAEVPPEGTLAPDSYEVTRDSKRSELLAEMTRRQGVILSDLWAERAADLPIDTPEEALILASIVEKETGIAAERPEVASVFINRLNQGMRLQTDPTVIYGITNGEGTLGRGLRRSELDRPTEFNTYQIDGLPPTPIANPGRDAIAAALNPAEGDYLYFVADGTGGHAFSRTLDEHNANVAKWRQIEAERANQ
ncbi:branched-chain alpha-keto acid dehydrogenase subunit E2 [Pacificitalea manganoxidans]|uniref:Endolytic murein transglycosylase n=1 Tax=Pacificitalea manganoxidans TaxID=1411902 RepID=A0A291LY61_9RHOB|nr:endolytic transglycosylase MltG [Pacificitalea manganoxidans]MAQ44380.1 branched-chain alpha-keto acid dehydrogenase subunit E2 [Actibacterium sp.]OWU71165.1 branched-chain alpha-keto acid dehydrogenase subunit E2 [Roseovarius sp. 22II1-1F6A]ATI41632.1 branched-chain alpha-keto acid dehydrogenase subunit E2 [Pacificitalea manganoxidans]MBF51957.1 branched-chain alpha-keto acid dehydrogenase subunit E2 [Actibacterium sp.]MDR6309072.1 UPF0755 protein [Pacificitalea manganoxidans]|tara:strand:+ start:179 stop:1333 length:1155 start_codon:yes stop_codon:yes gene_type:complete